MSLAVLTDSTTAHASPALTLRPAAGNSNNTMSVNSACAWSVMPMVAVSPLTRTHSCYFAYFKSEGTLLISFISGLFPIKNPPADYADGTDSQINFGRGGGSSSQTQLRQPLRQPNATLPR